tara:strand:+ start:20598 stop:21980 length:1383 start_codon:yes stop_codon:yes gene_type:complete
MRVNYFLPFLICTILISFAKAQDDSLKKEDMKLIYSSDWDWDWHCNCRKDNQSDKNNYRSRKYKNSKGYNYYYRNDGIDNEFDLFSQIGPNPAVYGFSPSIQAIHYNRVNGLFLGLDTEFDDFIHDFTDDHDLEVQALAGYSFGQEEWQYQIGLEKPIGYRFRIGADFHNVTATDDYWRSGLTENTVSSLISGYDYHDYYKSEGYSVYSSLRLFRSTYLGISYGTDTFNSLEAVTAYNIFGDGNIFRSNPRIDSNFDKISHESAGFSLNMNPKLYNITQNFSTSLELRGEIGNLTKTSNEFLFNKYIVQAKSIVRLDRSTFLRWRVMGGAITGVAPDFKQFALGGIGSMRATEYKSMQGNTMLLSNMELVFGRHSDLDMGFLEIDGLYISLFMDSGWTEFNSRLANTLDPFSAFDNFTVSELIHNIGFGIGSDVFRVEFAKPISNDGGFSAFWIRLNPTF